jgi:hypothetical protein
MPRSLILAAAFLTALPALACSAGDSGRGSGQVISREAFIEAYVELRAAAQRSNDQEIPLAERDRILESLGLRPEDLLEFIEVHGTNATFMHEVWQDVDERFREARTDPRPQTRGDPSGPTGG